ncbi:MAG: hypothetical protein ABIY62_05935 [Ginsengibacter sp.]
MKKYFYLFILIFLVVSNVKAQTPTSQFSDSTIKITMIRSGKSLTTLYSRNRAQITEVALKKLLSSYPASALELNAYKAQKRKSSTTTLILLSGAISSMIAGGIEADHKKNESGSAFSKSPVFFSISIACLLSPFFLIRKNLHLNKAIQAYNSRF